MVQLPQNGILGGGGGMLGLSFQGFVGARVLLVDETNDISRSGRNSRTALKGRSGLYASLFVAHS